MKDFESEVPVHLESQKIINLLKDIKFKNDPKKYLDNLLKCYEILIKNKIFKKEEIFYLKAWISDFKRINFK
jgi:hypothetical protein